VFNVIDAVAEGYPVFAVCWINRRRLRGNPTEQGPQGLSNILDGEVRASSATFKRQIIGSEARRIARPRQLNIVGNSTDKKVREKATAGGSA
jgi:hypothetical protein